MRAHLGDDWQFGIVIDDTTPGEEIVMDMTVHRIRYGVGDRDEDQPWEIMEEIAVRRLVCHYFLYTS